LENITLQDTVVSRGSCLIKSCRYCIISIIDWPFNGVKLSVVGQVVLAGPSVYLRVTSISKIPASGETIEVGDGAGIRANTGSVTLDRTVYPVPFGVTADFVGGSQTASSQPNGRSVFPIHQSGVAATTAIAAGEFISNGDLTIHVRVNDPDWDLSASGEDQIGTNSSNGYGPVKISVIRGSSTVVLGMAGGPTALDGTIDTDGSVLGSAPQFGPMVEVSPDSGIFESDITITVKSLLRLYLNGLGYQSLIRVRFKIFYGETDNEQPGFNFYGNRCCSRSHRGYLGDDP
jgi:hypothetical protein